MSIGVPFKQLHIEDRHIYEAMGYTTGRFPERHVMELAEQLMEQAAVHCKPFYSYLAFNGSTGNNGFDIEPYRFKTGKTIAKALGGSEQFVLFVATAGSELQAWVEQYQEDIVTQFIADSIGSVIAEAVADYMQEAIASDYSRLGLNCTNRYSPGYCGWNVSEQQQLFSLMKGRTCNVSLTDSNLMIPVKSVSGVIGVGKQVVKRDYGCTICSNVSCFKRKVR